jgi:hypothetical protein
MQKSSKESPMQSRQYFFWFTGIVSTLIVLVGCAQQAAIRRLTPTEQQEFRAYSKVMTAKQVRAYLARETTASRAAYLDEIGVSERFQALTAQDQKSVLAGYIRKGMSAEALHFLWGDPYYTKGRPGYYEHWFYQGPSVALAETGNQRYNFGSQVQVIMINGQVDGWLDFIPSHDDDDSDSKGDSGGCEGCS